MEEVEEQQVGAGSKGRALSLETGGPIGEGGSASWRFCGSVGPEMGG